ncbi:MAG: LTA synthase family protein [Bacteroidia bacterium]
MTKFSWKKIRQSEPLMLLWAFIKSYIFWFLFFAFNRFIFIAYNHDEWEGIQIKEVLFSFISALHLDLSMASYFGAVTFILFLSYSVFRQRIYIRIQSWFQYLFIILCIIGYAFEIPIYDEWHTKLSRKAVLILSHPSEVYNSATPKEFFGGLFVIFSLCAVFIFSYKRWFSYNYELKRFYWPVPVIGILLFPLLILLGIRGGLQEIPIQQSDAYYSQSNFLNLASVNTFWNVGQSFWENRKDDGTNPYKLYSDAESKKIVAELFSVKKDTFPEILTTKNPNVVLIILESWSADLLKSLSGFDSVAPNMENLISDGIEFTQFYSSGTLSDQGHCALLSAFPSQPCVVIMRQPDKFQKLPSIVSHFKKRNYFTAYYFGGQLEYGNIKGYIYFNKYDKIVEGKDFGKNLPIGKLGYHDQFLFGKLLTDLPTFREPFFTTAFTMSSHSPFDYPGETKYFSWGGDENMYVNGAHYADSCIGAFMREAKKQPWYKNTLFVFSSDHSHNTPKHTDFYNPRSRQIVGFLYGDVIKPEFHGMKIDKMGDHNDLANTLLKQLGGDATPFFWSKNLLNPYTKDFGYSADEYLNFFFDKNNAYVYRYTDQLFLHKEFRSPQDSAKIFRYGSAYLQELYRQYLSY